METSGNLPGGQRRPAPAASIAGDEGGASAIEFGILAPVLVFALLATVDVGLAVHERMEMDNVLRAGAEAAMGDMGPAKVREIASTVAQDRFTVAEHGSDGDFTLEADSRLSLAVERFCACPEAKGAKVDCTGATPCADKAKPYVYYRLQAEKDYQAVLLPALSLNSTVQIQAR